MPRSCCPTPPRVPPWLTQPPAACHATQMMLKQTKGLIWPMWALALASTLLFCAGLAAVQVSNPPRNLLLSCASTLTRTPRCSRPSYPLCPVHTSSCMHAAWMRVLAKPAGPGRRQCHGGPHRLWWVACLLHAEARNTCAGSTTGSVVLSSTAAARTAHGPCLLTETPVPLPLPLPSFLSSASPACRRV